MRETFGRGRFSQRASTHRTLKATALRTVAIATITSTTACVHAARSPAHPVTVHRCVSDTLHLPDPLVRRETVDTIVPGITYTCLLLPQGPWLVHVATIELDRRTLVLDAVRATDHMTGRERVSAMAGRLATRGEHPLVGINADFFDLGTGEIENNNVIHGEWVKGTLTTDSPHDEFDNAHTQFAIDARGAPRIGRFALEGAVLAPAGAMSLVGINYRPPRIPGLVLYTPWYGARTLTDTLSRAVAARPRDPDAVAPARAGAPPAPAAAGASPPSVPQLRADSARRETLAATREAVEVALVAAGRRGDTLLYRLRDGAMHVGGGLAIPADGAVLSATGTLGDRGVARGGQLRRRAARRRAAESGCRGAAARGGRMAARGTRRPKRRSVGRFARGDLPPLLRGAPSTQRDRALPRLHTSDAGGGGRTTPVERGDVARRAGRRPARPRSRRGDEPRRWRIEHALDRRDGRELSVRSHRRASRWQCALRQGARPKGARPLTAQ